MSTKILILAAVLSALLVGGCVSVPERELSTTTPEYAALPNGRDPLKPNQFASVAESGDAGVFRYYEELRGHALNILQLSGGGQNGAFGAGFLNGWTERGDRPQFDIVTGVSTGALLATHALLGTPADDAALKEIFTEITSANIYKKAGIFNILSRAANSYYDTTPLKQLIAKYITPEVVERVAAAYDEGRRLVIGTTNLDYHQTWAWNLTLLAKREGVAGIELFRDVLLASASPPVAFPPVELDGHLFVDGGIRQNMLVVGLAGTEWPAPPLYGPGNVYIIHNGRFNNEPSAVRPDIKILGGIAFNTMMDASMQGILLRAYFGVRSHGYIFNMVEIPKDTDIGDNSLGFEHKNMLAGYNAGVALGKQADPWAHRPPGFGDIPPWAMEYIKSDQ
jgi:hypothetical protein